jgi:acyl-CoA synthetase (AMP-forming)/AMP-acid ligase II/acyl carrier protein
MHAARRPDANALLGIGGAPMSYGHLHRQFCRTVAALREFGIRRHDRVGIVLSNGPELVAAFLSAAGAGIAAPLNPAYRQQEFDFYLSDLDARAVLVQQGSDSCVREVARRRGIGVVELTPADEGPAGSFTLTAPIASTPAPKGFTGPDDVALILHTSGTTSRPKMVPLTQANVCCSAENIRRSLELTPSDRCLNVMPLFHIHGLVGAVLSSLLAGAEIVCAPGFDGRRFFGWLAQFRPSWYTAVPTMHQEILARLPEQEPLLEGVKLRLIRSSSASLPPQVMHQLERTLGAPVIESYGMTEAAHQMCSNPLPPRARKPGTVGTAAGPEVAIMDARGNLLCPGDIGEIVIRGPNVTAGYLGNRQANEEAFTGGWFRTGDQGVMDEEGYLRITGRIKELINRGGEKISPREVDEALLDHPAVLQAVTFAVPHPRLGEDVAAAVILRDGGSVSESKLRRFAVERLADHKVPSQIVFVDQIPKGPTGKLQRIGLADKLEHVLQRDFVAPSGPVERTLAEIWAEVLGLEAIGMRDNFFYLGGDSIRATQVIARVRDQLQVDLPPSDLFRAPTIAEFAERIGTARKGRSPQASGTMGPIPRARQRLRRSA